MHPEEFQTTEQLLPLVYAELRRLAAHKMANEHPGQTLQPTALVHEAWLKLGENRKWQNRNHFFAAAAEAMRRIDRKSTRLNSSHSSISYAVFCLKKKKELTRNELTKTQAPWLGNYID